MLTVQFSDFPVLQTDRLLLREVTHQDAPVLFDLRSMDAVMQYLDRPKPKDIREIMDLIDQIKKDFEQSNGISWIITTRDADKAIGTIGFWRLDKPNHRAEIGYMLHPDEWGKGLASEAMHAVLPYAFETLHFHSIEANVNPLNEASKNLLLKLGFVQEANFRENYYFDGRFLDSAIFCLLGQEYTALKERQTSDR
jgi:ribosomal-protein-alanine N-acetyltransferase